MEDGRRVHEKYDREENSVLGVSQAFPPVEDDEPSESVGGGNIFLTLGLGWRTMPRQ